MNAFARRAAPALFLIVAAAAAEGTSGPAHAAAAPAGQPTLVFTETYRGALRLAGGNAFEVETERCVISATLPYPASGAPPAFAGGSVLHVNVGRFVFDGPLSGDARYVPGKRKSARLVVSSENDCGEGGQGCRTRVYATATVKWIAAKKNRPGMMTLKISGARSDFVGVLGVPGADFSIVAPALWTSQLSGIDAGAGTAPSQLSSSFSVDSVVSLGALSATFGATYVGTSKPKVRTDREIVDYTDDTFRPIFGTVKHVLANVAITGTGMPK